MSKIFLTSDLHLGHQKDFLYSPRGFDNIYDHDKAIIKNWNAIVEDDDLVYILGDIMLNDCSYGSSCFNQLKGYKRIILGNHDTEAKINDYPNLRGVESISFADQIRKGKYTFFLCHYPTFVDNFDRGRKFYCLHGHTHSPDKFQIMDHCCYNVALDAHDMKPIALDDIVSDIQKYRQEKNNE